MIRLVSRVEQRRADIWLAMSDAVSTVAFTHLSW